MCEIQFKIGDDIRIQKRSFMKMSEVFAITGGYMQLISTIFKIISLWSNKLSYEEKIINSLFNIYPEKGKITLKNKMQNKLNDFSDKNNINKINISDYLIQSKNIDINSNDPTKECIKINKPHKNLNKNLVEEKSKDLINLNENKSKADLLNIGSNCNSINIINRLQKQNNKNTIASEVNEDNKSKKININLFYYCFPKCKNSTDAIKLFNLSLSFYKKEMDITHLFYIILLIEKISKNNNLIINN